ncbi:MAG: hypothetical protein ACHQHP_03110 [Bacteroidia bacterium]
MKTKIFFYLFIFCLFIVKAMAQQTEAVLLASNNSSLHNRSTAHRFSVPELQYAELPVTSNNYTLSNYHTTAPMINAKAFKFKFTLHLSPIEGALLTGVAGAIFGYYAVNFNSHPAVSSSVRRTGALVGFLAFAPIGYGIFVDF